MLGLQLKRKIFKPPTPEERRANIAAIKWWWFEYIGYEPHTAQLDGHMYEARFRMCIAGTRGGKSRMAGEEAVVYLLAGATRVWILGQNYALTEKEFRYIYERMTSPEMREFLGGEYPLVTDVYNLDQGNMHIKTKWGAEVQCLSLDKGGAAALGEECDLIILSESAIIKNPKMVWERYLRGRLASRMGDLLIPTTPGGKTNKHDEEGWLFDMYMKGYDPDEPDYFTREWPSWENPDGFKEDPYELRRTMDPKIFSEQYEGKFMIFSGTVLNFDENVHVIQPFDIPTHWRAYEAIDPGWSGRFVWLRSVVSPTNTIYITDEYDDSEQLFGLRASEIKRHRAEAYNIHPSLWDVFVRKNQHVTRTYVDSEDPQAMAELELKYGLPNEPTTKDAKNVLVSVNRVNERLKYSDRYPPKLYITANCVNTIEACNYHSWGDKQGNSVRKPANDKWKHWVDCMRYINGGTIIPSDFHGPREVVDGETYWDLMEGMQMRANLHPFDMTQAERRVA